ncbi:Galactose oxidase central domain [Trypanosoma vivax]|nr:Galactose oxidase central domain [Trypanosoma vivax]
MEWLPCEERVGSVGSREGHCATCLPSSDSGDEWVLCIGGYCEGQCDGAVLVSRASELPVLRWMRITDGNPTRFQRDGASLARGVGDRAYLFGGVDAEMSFSDSLIVLTLCDAQGDAPLLQATELRATGDAPSPRARHSAGCTSTHLLVFGGETSSAAQTNDTFRLHLDTLVWQRVVTGPAVPAARLLAGPILFISEWVGVLYGGAHFANGDIKSLNDAWTLNMSGHPTWAQVGVNNTDGHSDYPFPRSNGHTGGVLRCSDHHISAVFVGGKDGCEGCDLVKEVRLDDGNEGNLRLQLVQPVLAGGLGPHWRYTPAAVETPRGLLLLGGQCRHPQEVAAFILRETGRSKEVIHYAAESGEGIEMPYDATQR